MRARCPPSARPCGRAAGTRRPRAPLSWAHVSRARRGAIATRARRARGRDERDDLDVDTEAGERGVEAKDARLAAAARRPDRKASATTSFGPAAERPPRPSCGCRLQLAHDAVPGHRRARSSAARPIRFAARRLDHSSSIAAASASGVGSATRPTTLSVTSSAVPPESVAGDDRLARRIASSVTSPKSSSVRDERDRAGAGVHRGRASRGHPPAEEIRGSPAASSRSPPPRGRCRRSATRRPSARPHRGDQQVDALRAGRAATQ